jgi:hypothetical protein
MSTLTKLQKNMLLLGISILVFTACLDATIVSTAIPSWLVIYLRIAHFGRCFVTRF